MSVHDFDSRTADSARATLRPRGPTNERMKAAESFSSFCFITSSIFSPPRVTGCAAPVLVPGAMAATSAASRMKKPADAARAPEGATYTITGTGDASIFAMIERVESTRPPGVRNSISTASALVCRACSMARPMYSSLMGWMVSSRRILTTPPAKAIPDVRNTRMETTSNERIRVIRPPSGGLLLSYLGSRFLGSDLAFQRQPR